MEPLVPIRVVPQRHLDPKDRAYNPGLWPEFVAGGLYLAEGEDWTGRRPAAGVVNVLSPNTPFLVSREEVAPHETGAIIRVNLFRRDAGWRWISTRSDCAALRMVVSVHTSKQHFYCLACIFQGGLTLVRAPEKGSEPRLRPTARGRLLLGGLVGHISVRGRPHPVFQDTTVDGGPA